MNSKLVRFSRGGDQFHYLWAARRCLRLLSASSGLVAITIEGVSPAESSSGNPIQAGESVIDVAEYYGNEEVTQSKLVRYIQLKHSTQNATRPWAPSGLRKTITGFAKRYRALVTSLGSSALAGRVEFVFVSNRPVATDILEAVEDAVSQAAPRHASVLDKLESYTRLTGLSFAAFCRALHLQGKQEGYWDQRNILVQEMSGYLPDADADAPVSLKELVTKKALPESAANPRITKIDVLRALKTDETRLLPAPCLIQSQENAIPREQEPSLITEIVTSGARAIIVHAAAGVGKTIFATRIQHGLPDGSLCVLYDCFGNGQYRSVTGYRHRHKDALVQIANELVQLALCYPLIPTPHADASAYVRAFLNRITQSIDSLRSANPNAILCVAIDAADNAQMAAEELGEPRSFARDLLREAMPDGLRLVVLCRTHRIHYLDPPQNVRRLELRAFSRLETARYLRLSYPDATELDIDEFHRLSSHNPRVQATAISRRLPLPDVLRALGPNPTTVDDTLARLLTEAISALRDQAGSIERAQVDAICVGLAALRPLVPISVLAALAQVNEAAIKSFAIDLGRPLILLGESVQFFDEPAETWFRDQFKPKAADFDSFIERLKPLASSSAYVASTLPQLMLEAGHISELVDLALSSTGLPEGSPVEKRDVELQRLQFALKAVLRTKRYTEAVKLALKAGGETAGDTRLQKLIRDNTDLAATLIDSNRILEIVSRRSFSEKWVGAHYVYEAGLMSGKSELRGDARSRLRMAHEWLKNWSRLSTAERDREQVEDLDIAELAIAHLNIDGPGSCAAHLRSWRPRDVSFRAGRILARRLVDHGRYDELDQVAVAAANDLGLILAIAVEVREVNRLPPKRVVARAFRLLQNPRVKLKATQWDMHERALVAVTALVEAALLHSIASQSTLASLLTRYLPESPPRGLSSPFSPSRFALLRAYALRSALLGETLKLADVAYSELKKQLQERRGEYAGGEARELQEGVGALLPWHQVWADTLTGRSPGSAINDCVESAMSSIRTSTRYEDRYRITDEIARLRWQLITGPGNCEAGLLESFVTWTNSLERALFTPTLTFIARGAGRALGLHHCALDFSAKAFGNTKDQRADAATKADTYIDLARAILTVSRPEANAYFDQAIDVAGKFGDEVIDRWQAILDLADKAAREPDSETAYKLSRCAEVTHEYVEDKHFDWTSTIRALVGLSPHSAVAILSRWRDRHFGRSTGVLPIAVKSLMEHGHITGRMALALIGFRSHWDYSALLNRALSECTSKAEKQIVADFAYRYMQLADQVSASAWRALRDGLSTHGVSVPQLDDLVSDREHAESAAKSNNRDDRLGQPRDSAAERDWDSIFAGLDLHSPNDVSAAYRRFRTGDPPFYRELFFRQVFSRIEIGRAAEFVHALPEMPQFDLYDLRSLLEEIPGTWQSQLSVKFALGELLKTMARQHCMGISKNRYYEPLPIKSACEICGVTEAELLDVVLVAIGEAPDLVDASRLFTLVGLLASRVSGAQALDGLRFGLTLFDSVMADSDGDGPWSPALAPSADMTSAFAGYIRAALGAPESRIRWEAAHVVRGLCHLEQAPVVCSLIEAFSNEDAGPFGDVRFYFYGRHSRQWLTIALARAASETPAILAPHLRFLLRVALEDEPHIIIRSFAANTVLALSNNGLVSIEPATRHKLTAINVSKYPRQSSKRYGRVSEASRKGKSENNSTRFHLGMDFGPYWLEPLASCFALTQIEVEGQVHRLIVDEWRHSDFTSWEKDERLRRRMFEDGETYYRHSSYPQTDDVRFYLSYHAMMVVTGRLLASTPLHQDPDDAEDEFHTWLHGHMLGRADGHWLADRRDPEPLDWPAWKDSNREDDWRWSVSKGDFDRVIGFGANRLNVWGDWSAVADYRVESVEIHSALVTPRTSQALLRALQTTANPYDYCIPKAGDDSEIDEPDFQLCGWVANRNRAHGIDELDRWVGNISYPPLKPAAWICDLMGLNADQESRVWTSQKEGERHEVFWSRSWGKPSEREDDAESEHGERLQATIEFVTQVLEEAGMDLVIEARIKRRASHSRYERARDDGLQYVPPYTRIFLFKSDGQICSL
jgi:hypothetical protein